MRPIDADALVKWLCGNKCGCERNECGYTIPCQQVQLLEGAPSIDIVRCRECKWWWKEWETCTHKNLVDGHTCATTFKADSFCSYGEREGE